MKKIIYTLILFLIVSSSFSQIVSINPANGGAQDEVVLTFRASEGNAELQGAEKVYIHHGVVTDAPDGTDWNYVIGNWGQDDGVGEMQAVTGEEDTWQIAFTPSVQDYFNVPESENIFRISAVFRSADGAVKGTIAPGEYGWGSVAANGDFFINLNSGPYVVFNAPDNQMSFLNTNDFLEITASASSEVNQMKLFVDAGSGFEEVASVNSGTTIEYSYEAIETTNLALKVEATINGASVEAVTEHQLVLVQDNNVAELPDGMEYGINYDDANNTSATLVLEAPGKDFVYVVGDFTEWQVQDSMQMNVTPDGEVFWLELNGLTPSMEYVFQYWMNDDVKVGDPYADKIADPWNDKYIEAEVYPDLPDYPYTDYGTATVLQTSQVAFEWAASESTWQRPDLDHLVIYELHVRDFIEDHNYLTLIDTLDYLKNLGITAIELMPVNEFEGNDSWGYNPSYYFAPDKYYGTKDQLKAFIEAAHQKGLAVILDMVLNHAYGQNAMVQMYFDKVSGKPSADNPWFNREYVGPYQWGYDFNHESVYTQNFIDKVNAYWIEEYHFDGFRFDFTKGFTNYAPGGNIDGFDQSRIDIMKRMADKIWEVDNDAYIILEHWGPSNEEEILADYGMKMWKNRSYDFVPAATGANSGSFSGMDALSHVSYFNSHDERRVAEHVLSEGLAYGAYDVRNPYIMYERVKMAAAFAFLSPGPKMMWQFDELAYDIHIDFNGRVGRKPLPWGESSLGYYDDALRQNVYKAYRGILDVRSQIDPSVLTNSSITHKLTGDTRRLSYDSPDTDLVLIGNFGLSDNSIIPEFSETGIWYDYFSGDSISVNDVSEAIALKAGEWRILTNKKLSDGIPGVVETFDSPVVVHPYPFTKNDQITLTFDAAKAWSNGTNGLLGAQKVYMHSGVLEHKDSTNFTHVVGTLTDDGVGEMTFLENDKWEISFIPKDYFGLTDNDEIAKIGLYFRDAANENQGMGFRNGMIYLSVTSEVPFIVIEPASFNANEEITITYNANQGNQELLGSNKVYMHSGASTVSSDSPQDYAWDHAVGNWGQDDGIGEMAAVEGKPGYWQISLTPQNYYELATDDEVYWLSFVFRNANGSVKGTGAPGEIVNGFIAANQDYFIKNLKYYSVPVKANNTFQFYPNPVNNELFVGGIKNKAIVEIYGLNGQLLVVKKVLENSKLDVSSLNSGLYFYKISTKDLIETGKFIKH